MRQFSELKKKDGALGKEILVLEKKHIQRCE